MPKPKKTRNAGVTTADYRHTGEKRKNIPPAKIAAEGKVPRVAKNHPVRPVNIVPVELNGLSVALLRIRKQVPLHILSACGTQDRLR